MKDDYTTNYHYVTLYTFAVRMYFLNLGVKGLMIKHEGLTPADAYPSISCSSSRENKNNAVVTQNNWTVFCGHRTQEAQCHSSTKYKQMGK